MPVWDADVTRSACRPHPGIRGFAPELTIIDHYQRLLRQVILFHMLKDGDSSHGPVTN